MAVLERAAWGFCAIALLIAIWRVAMGAPRPEDHTYDELDDGEHDQRYR